MYARVSLGLLLIGYVACLVEYLEGRVYLIHTKAIGGTELVDVELILAHISEAYSELEETAKPGIYHTDKITFGKLHLDTVEQVHLVTVAHYDQCP